MFILGWDIHSSLKLVRDNGQDGFPEELGELLLVRVTPPEAEGVTGGIGVHAVSFVGFRVRCILEESSTEIDGATMRCCRIGHVEIDVNLLWLSVRPVRRNVVRCPLHADEPVPLAVDDAVELRVLVDHAPIQHGSPERAHRCYVCSIEHHDMTNQIHSDIL